MEDREKVLRWDLQEAIEEAKENIDEISTEHPLMYFDIIERRKKKVEKCQKSLDDYLKTKTKWTK